MARVFPVRRVAIEKQSLAITNAVVEQKQPMPRYQCGLLRHKEGILKKTIEIFHSLAAIYGWMDDWLAGWLAGWMNVQHEIKVNVHMETQFPILVIKKVFLIHAISYLTLMNQWFGCYFIYVSIGQVVTISKLCRELLMLPGLHRSRYIAFDSFVAAAVASVAASYRLCLF